MNDLRLLDLFSGIGGFSLAAKWLGGFRTVQFVEQDSFCQQVLHRHWPTVPIHDDIRTFTPPCNSADVVCAGFPCQDISVAGRQAGIKEGTRSGLFYELMRVVRLVGPRYIVLENVSAIVSNGLDIVLGELAAIGYDCEWACISAADLGFRHRRDRWWAVAYPSCDGMERGRTTEVLWKPALQRGENKRSAQDISRRCDGFTPRLCRSAYGLPAGVDRLRALGNAVVPWVAMVPLARVLELAKADNSTLVSPF